MYYISSISSMAAKISFRSWRTHSCVPRRHSCRRLLAASHIVCGSLYYTIANSSQPATILARPESVGRKKIAQRVSAGNGVKDRGSPGTGRKSFYSGASFAPFRGWSIGYGNPRLTPWAMLFRPPGLVLCLRLCRFAGQAILPCSRLSGGFFGAGGAFLITEKRRLKAGGSQDWLPHRAAW